ncbi:MAG: hypothetical protein J2P15_21880, partial [Micromonosporaceae bacterium]|nr:hypothetical protein [Micromonosporaceae bacterium]
RLLRDAPVPPITTDLERALVAGRRGERVRRYATVTGGGLAAMLVLVGATVGVAELRGTGGAARVAGSPTAPSPSGRTPESSIAPTPPGLVSSGKPCFGVGPSYRLGSPVVSPRVGDPTGEYLVGDGDSPVLWTADQFRVLPRPAGVGAGRLSSNAVNSRGEVVGGTLPPGGLLATAGYQRAWVYRDGASSLLPLPSGYDRSVAYGINSTGDIVGAAWKGNDGQRVPVRWPASGGSRVLPASHTQYGATARAIGDDGTVVGTLEGSTPLDGTPYVWPAQGAGHALPSPAGTSGGGALAIRGDWVAGWVRPPHPTINNSPEEAARWNLRTGEATAYPNNIEWATAVNSSGDLLVETSGTYIHNGQSHSIAGGWPLSLPDAGQGAIVGLGTVGTGPVYWHCG